MSGLPAVHRLYGAEAYFYASRFGFRLKHSRKASNFEHYFIFLPKFATGPAEWAANWSP
jgi:hypothetical protein